MPPIDITQKLSHEVERLSFSPPITHIYNPLSYAWRSHAQYLKKYAHPNLEILLVGMNPGPWGMVQTGVPFGEVTLVRDWLGIEETVDKPACEHPKRPIQGFACPRSEVSGARLWGWARERYDTADVFFQRFFVYNYCPLSFMETSGRNFTPDKLPATEKKPLFELCDNALRDWVSWAQPRFIIGIGGFAEKRIQTALRDHPHNGSIGRILHPSPASPAANRGWAAAAETDLKTCGITL